MRTNEFNQKLNDRPWKDLLFRFILWWLAGLVLSTLAMHGNDEALINSYINQYSGASLKTFNRLGMFSIVFAVLAIGLENAERSGWSVSKKFSQLALILRRCANDVLLSVFGLGASITGFFIAVAIKIGGTISELVYVGLVTLQFLLVVLLIGFVNYIIRADKQIFILRWQARLSATHCIFLYGFLFVGFYFSVPWSSI